MLILGGIGYSDWRYRGVYWAYFTDLIIAFILLRAFCSVDKLLLSLFVNLNLIFIKLAVLTLVLSLKKRKVVRVWQGKFSIGDIIFLVSIAFYLSVLNFLVFDAISQIVILLSWQLYRRCRKNTKNKVPLAGMQAIILGVLLIADWYWLHIDVTSDDWLVNPLILWNPLKFY